MAAGAHGSISRAIWCCPSLTLGLFYVALYTRLMRASMLEVYSFDFITTARAKGLSETRVALCHAAANALLPVVTMAGVQVGHLLGGSILVETVFGWPGLGRLLFDALLQRDLNLLLGILFVSSILVVFANLAVDLLYGCSIRGSRTNETRLRRISGDASAATARPWSASSFLSLDRARRAARSAGSIRSIPST